MTYEELTDHLKEIVNEMAEKANVSKEAVVEAYTKAVSNEAPLNKKTLFLD